jgi:hypothetical protein
VLKVDGPKRDSSELNGLRPGRSNRRDQGGRLSIGWTGALLRFEHCRQKPSRPLRISSTGVVTNPGEGITSRQGPFGMGFDLVPLFYDRTLTKETRLRERNCRGQTRLGHAMIGHGTAEGQPGNVQ